MDKPKITRFKEFENIFIAKYDRYIPTAFDESLSLIEKMNKLIEYLNRIGKVANDMIDNWNAIYDFIQNKGLEDVITKRLEEWYENGELAALINNDLFNEFTHTITNLFNSTVQELNDKMDAIANGNPIDVVEDVSELESKYPNGRNGIVIVKSDGYYYYYSNGWKKGALYIDPLSYALVKTDGKMSNLNLSTSWINNPDITTLKTGFYTLYMQHETSKDFGGINNNYPITINAPHNMAGGIVSLKVYQHDNGIRTDYEVVVNYSNITYSNTLRSNGELSGWKITQKADIDNPMQQFRLTYHQGNVMPFGEGNTQNLGRIDLVVPLTELKTGFYYGSINEDVDNEFGDRKLPYDFIYGQICFVQILKTSDKRVSIMLHAAYSGMSWVGYTATNTSRLIWKRLDIEKDMTINSKLSFGRKVNKIKTDNYKSLIITDTHAQVDAKSEQIGHINIMNMDDVYTIETYLNSFDSTVHLGDILDGNHSKEESFKSLVKFTQEFKDKKHRHMIIGNHDYNAQWDGFTGNNGQYKHDLNHVFTKDEMLTYFGKDDKTYYYNDNDEKNIREIFLNSFDICYELDENGNLQMDPLNEAGFGNEQIEWYINTLNSVPEGYDVVVYSHDTFDNVFNDIQYINGDVMRVITETYQSKSTTDIFQSDITELSPVYNYYKLEREIDFTNANGKVMAVINGHRHIDNTTFKKGVRYISLLCSRAEGGSSDQKPARDYLNATRNAITLIEFDKTNETIYLYRYGAGKDYIFRMYE